MEYFGTLRITNPKTLEEWKQNGKYQELMDEGYVYAKGCGRFRMEVCTCSKCRKRELRLKLNLNLKGLGIVTINCDNITQS